MFLTFLVLGTAGDSLTYHHGQAFSPKDPDNDEWSSGNCPLDRQCAWWYKYCAISNLNGLYLNGKVSDKGMQWNNWKNNSESVQRSEMKIHSKKQINYPKKKRVLLL